MSSLAGIERRRARRQAHREAAEAATNAARRAQGLVWATTFEIVPTATASERGADTHEFELHTKEQPTQDEIAAVIKERGGDPALSSNTPPRRMQP